MSKPRFIAWYGGECPVDGSTKVDVLISGRKRPIETEAWRVMWYECPEWVHVIAYRVIEDKS